MPHGSAITVRLNVKANGRLCIDELIKLYLQQHSKAKPAYLLDVEHQTDDSL